MHKHLPPRKRVSLCIAAIVLDTTTGHDGLRLGQEVERRVRALRKVGHPPVRHDPKERSDRALHNEHPLPTLQPVGAIETIQAVVYDAAGCQDGNFAALHEGEAELLLLARVPYTQEIRKTRVDARHGDTE